MLSNEKAYSQRALRDRKRWVDIQRQQLRRGVEIIGAMMYKQRLTAEAYQRRMKRIVRIGKQWGIDEEELRP